MSILKSFIKYQSLGNDFVIFDWYKRPSLYMHNELHEASWQGFVKNICDRHYGVGADGVLVVTNCPEAGMPEMLVYNADGSPGGNCLNGLRSVAHYLFTQYHFPTNFKIKLGSRTIDCLIKSSEATSGSYSVVSHVGTVDVKGPLSITINKQQINGTVVTIGNPHFIVFESTTREWLSMYGSEIECHKAFSDRTNVEFVTPLTTDSKTNIPAYNILVFERGSGMTLACSSGAAAITGFLYNNGSIGITQKVAMHMPGGIVTTWINEDLSVALEADAHIVFRGSFEDNLSHPEQISYTQHRV